MYDTIIVGGGPAGLTAGLHLAWHDRKVLILDRRTGPLFFTIEELFNVPGMPNVKGIDLQRQLAAQAKEMGAELRKANVVTATGSEGDFTLTLEGDETLHARTVLLATGVARYHPTADGDYRACFKYAGKGNLYYCPDCEAPLINNKPTVVIATSSARGGAYMALGLSRYTDKLRVLVTAENRELDEELAHRLNAKGIEVIFGEISEFVGKTGHLESLRLANGTSIDAEAFFVSSPVVGRTDLAQQLGVEMAATKNHAQPKSQRGDTNVPGVWIAGDIRPMTQQVAVAMGTGNIAAVMVDQHLRKQDVAAAES